MSQGTNTLHFFKHDLVFAEKFQNFGIPERVRFYSGDESFQRNAGGADQKLIFELDVQKQSADLRGWMGAFGTFGKKFLRRKLEHDLETQRCPLAANDRKTVRLEISPQRISASAGGQDFFFVGIIKILLKLSINGKGGKSSEGGFV